MLDYQYHALLYPRYRQHYHGFRPWTQMMSSQSLAASAVTGSAKHLPHLPYGISLPYLSQEPPVLQNPERVVRLSECERFEQSYQPNVALAPRLNHKHPTTASTDRKERESDFECDDERVDRDESDVRIKKERPQTPPEESTSPVSRIEASIVAPISPEEQSGSSNEITSSTSPVPAPTTTTHKPIDATMHSPKTPSSHALDSHHMHHLMHRSQAKAAEPIRSCDQETPSVLTNGIYYHSKLNGAPGNSEFELSTDTDEDSLAGEADSSNSIATLDIAIEALKDTRQQERDKVLAIIKALLGENVQLNAKNNKLRQELRRRDDQISDLLQMQRKSHNGSTNSISNCSVNATVESMTTVSKSPEQSLTIIKSTASLDSSESTNCDVVEPSTKPSTAIADTNGESNEKKTKGESNEVKSTISATTTTTTLTATAAVAVTSIETPRKKSEADIIRVPLKKSARRSPEESTMVIMQPHKLREEARDKSRDKLDKILRYAEQRSKSPSPNPIQENATATTAKANEAA